MQQKELEFRTEELNLLLFKVLTNSEANIFIDVKNGKREEIFSLEKFVSIINRLISDSNVQLQIVPN